MPSEVTREEVLEVLRVCSEKDSVIEGLAESIAKMADNQMELVEELKKIKIAMNGGGCNECSAAQINWDERIVVNKQYDKTMSPKEMLLSSLVFLAQMRDLFIKYTDKRVLKKELTSLAVWNWKVVAVIAMLLFGGSVGPDIWFALKAAVLEVLSRGGP